MGRASTCVALAAMGWFAAASISGADEPRSVALIIKELDAVQIPTFDFSRKGDQDYAREYPAKRQQATERRNALILEAYKAAPDDDRIPGLMAERWSIRQFGLAADELQRELDGIIARTTNRKLKVEAVYAKDYAIIYDGKPGDPPDAALEEFGRVAPGDPRNLDLLWLAATRAVDAKVKSSLEDRILDKYPDSLPTRKILGFRLKDERHGKPIDLDFDDAINGQPVSLKSLKGKVIVLDFWATWCVPCVQDMPKMKDLYARYHDRGVEFIGVSLDRPEAQGGLDALRKYVKAEKIPWPQFYQGQGWDSDFSVSWGITTIPTLFVFDDRGNLVSTSARDRLDVLLDELLEGRNSVGTSK